MKNISEIDANFKIETSLNVKGVRFLIYKAHRLRSTAFLKRAAFTEECPKKPPQA